MSRSYKKNGCKNLYRHPKGRKKAIINNVRHRAIPPDPWGGINHSKDCYIPVKVARKMKKEGANEKRILKTLKNKFKLNNYAANHIIDIVFDHVGPFWRI